MPTITYREIAFRPATLAIIDQANVICAEYAAAGYSLTLRQLYYQFVSRGLIDNRQSEYKRLGSIVDDARYAGLLDWDYIIDRTRRLQERPAWGTAREADAKVNSKTFVDAVMPQFQIRKWDTQSLRMEVWIEKDALVDVIARPANDLQVPFFASRGYNSTSNAWKAAQRIEGYYDDGAKRVVILHLGDHDPEGIDMTRDIEDRFRTFLDGDGYQQAWSEMTVGEYDGSNDVRPPFEIRRIALNMDQVRRYQPPPNPAKESSSRFDGYLARFGTRTSWELDALDPPTIDALIRVEVAAERDEEAWAAAVENERIGRELLRKTSDRWADVVEFLA
jgi:hypothetical protein